MPFLKNKIVVYGLLFMPAAFFAVPALAYAATMVYFDAPTSSIPIGAEFTVAAMVDTDQPVNAYSIHVGFSGSGTLRYDGANNAGSLITITQDNPVFSGGGVSFSGGSLTPFDGVGGKLMMLNFKAVGTGTVRFSFNSSYVYLANGKGTKVVPQAKGATIAIIPAGPGAVSGTGDNVGGTSGGRGDGPGISADDKTPPAISYLSLVKDPFNDGQKLLGFSVADDGSGVKGAEMRYRSGFFWTEWSTIRNPAPLPPGVWEVDFKTVDNAGNTTERTLYDWAAFARLAGVIAVIAVFLLGIALLFRRGRMKMVE